METKEIKEEIKFDDVELGAIFMALKMYNKPKSIHVKNFWIG